MGECETCRWWSESRTDADLRVDYRQCRRFPPSVIRAGPWPIAGFIMTPNKAWCGEYAAIRKARNAPPKED